MSSFLFPIFGYTSVAGEEKREVVATYSIYDKERKSGRKYYKTKHHGSEIVLLEKIPIEEDPMDIENNQEFEEPEKDQGSKKEVQKEEDQESKKEVQKEPEEDQDSKKEVQKEPVESSPLPKSNLSKLNDTEEPVFYDSVIDPEEADKIAQVMRQSELNYLTSMVKSLCAKEPPVEEVIKVGDTKDFIVEVVPFKAIVLRDPTTGTIVQMLPFPYARTKMVKVYANDYDECMRRYAYMFPSQFPKVVSSNNVYQIWEVPYEYDSIVTYKTEIVHSTEVLEARAIANFYKIFPIVEQRGDTEVWTVPSSFPMPKPKEKYVQIQKQLIGTYLNLYTQRYFQRPIVVDTTNPEFDVWLVPVTF